MEGAQFLRIFVPVIVVNLENFSLAPRRLKMTSIKSATTRLLFRWLGRNLREPIAGERQRSKIRPVSREKRIRSFSRVRSFRSGPPKICASTMKFEAKERGNSTVIAKWSHGGIKPEGMRLFYEQAAFVGESLIEKNAGATMQPMIVFLASFS